MIDIFGGRIKKSRWTAGLSQKELYRHICYCWCHWHDRYRFTKSIFRNDKRLWAWRWNII